MESYPIAPGKKFVRYKLTDGPVLVLAAAVLCLPLMLFGFGLRHHLWQRNFDAVALTATGTVTRVDQQWGDSGTLYTPTVRFETTNSPAPILFRSRVSSGRYYAVGESVVVRFDPKNVRRAELQDTVGSPVLAFGMMGVSGAFLAVMGTVLRNMLAGFETDDNANDP